MNETDKYYQILGLKPDVSEKEVLEAYKVLVKVWHPDRFSDDPQLRNIAMGKIKEIDEAFKHLLLWTESRQVKGGEIIELQVEAITESPKTRESIEIKATAKPKVPPKQMLVEPMAGKVWKDPYLGMEFVFIKGGTYQMRDVFGDGNSDEKPVHEVYVDGFWIGKYPVTQGQWKKLMTVESRSKITLAGGLGLRIMDSRNRSCSLLSLDKARGAIRRRKRLKVVGFG